jgi:hypothetical protein
MGWAGPYRVMVFSPPVASGNPRNDSRWEWGICGDKEGGIVRTEDEAKKAAASALVEKLRADLAEALLLKKET